ncbi:retrovirus-related pol polyprotein from transposon TNT 1-94 [Tanacetum coccineum]
MKDKVVQNNSKVKIKKKEVEDHHMISSISNKTKSVTVCNDSLKSRTSNVNVVCVTCGNYMFNSNHDACVSKFIHDVNARTNTPNVVLISTRKPKRKANQSIATPHNKRVASESTIQKSKSYVRMLYEKTNLEKTSSPTPICFMAKAKPTQAWLWHRRLSYLNFDTINLLSKKDIVNGLPKLKYVKDQLCSSCELGKAKKSSFKTKTAPSSKGWLHLLHMDLCGPMRVESINGKKYILVIVDDYSQYTWTYFLRSKDETPKVLIDFLKLIQRGLQAQVITVRTDRGTEFLNKTLHAYFKEEGIKHQTLTSRTPQQNDVVERRNRTLIEAVKQCFRLLNVHSSFGLKKPTLKHLHIFGCTCYIVRDGENLDKMKEKGDPCILVGYSTQSKGYRVYNKRTVLIVESIHINFDEITELSQASDYDNSSPAPQLQNTSGHNRSELEIYDHSNEPSSSKLVPNVSPPADTDALLLQELDFLFNPLFKEYFIAGNQSVSKYFALFDNSKQQDTQPITPPTNVNVEENNTDQAEDACFEPYEFINPFCTPIQKVSESSSLNVDNSNIHTFYQRHCSDYH